MIYFKRFFLHIIIKKDCLSVLGGVSEANCASLNIEEKKKRRKNTFQPNHTDLIKILHTSMQIGNHTSSCTSQEISGDH